MGLAWKPIVNCRSELSPTVRGIFSIVKEALKVVHDEGYIGAIWIGVIFPKKKKSAIDVFSKEEQRLYVYTQDYA